MRDHMEEFQDLFPAYAGVIPMEYLDVILSIAFPRIRGGDPGVTIDWGDGSAFSPHTRG